MKAFFAACAMLVLAACNQAGPKPLTAADISATVVEINATDMKIKELAATIAKQCGTAKAFIAVADIWVADPTAEQVLAGLEVVRDAYCRKAPPTDVASLIRVSADMAIAIQAVLAAQPAGGAL